MMLVFAVCTLMATVLVAPHLSARSGVGLGLLFAFAGVLALVAASAGRAA